MELHNHHTTNAGDLQAVLSRLRGVKESSGGQYTARCPAHDDRENSLSVGVSDDGAKILMNCFAGCSFESILSALGLVKADLRAKKRAPETTPSKVGETTYEYHDASGALLYYRIRTDYSDGTKKVFFKQPNGTMNVKGIARVPYNLPAVLEALTVYIVEGEKCADAIIRAGRTATTLDSGASSKWLPEYAPYFRHKEVIIIPDNDAPGMKYASRIAKNIADSKIVRLPGLADKEDIYDWLRAGHTMDELDALAAAKPNPETEVVEEKEPRVTQAEILLQIVDGTGADYFHSETNDLYAAIPVAGHIEIWPLDGKDFAIWLHGLYYGEMGRPASNEAVGQAVSVLSARARFDRPEAITLHTRAAERDGAIWYDLTNPAWQVIKITPDGWRVHDSPLIMFNRYRHQAPQIMPQPGGDVKRILRYVNLKGQHTLFLCCLISYLVPGIPHAMLIFFGEKGAAKTTASSLLKTLIDPSALETLTLQNDPRTLAVNLQQHWFLPFDNVSHINEETSDTLCRAITGGGIQQRKLFTNADDTIFTFKRCLAINGINNVATRPDLLDRSLLVELERIAEHDRRELADIKAEFEADRPAILGGILDTLARAMAIFPTVKLDNLPRMADFARWGYAIGEALGGLGRQFLDEYAENRNSQNTEAINSDPVATLIVEFMSGRAEWDGTVSALYSELTSIAAAHNISTQRRAFPADPARLTKRINGIKSNLEAVGITFKKWHNRNGNYISLSMTDLPSQASHRHKPSDTNAFGRDASVTVRDGKTSSVTPSVTGKPLQILNCDASDGSDGKNSTLRGGVL